MTLFRHVDPPKSPLAKGGLKGGSDKSWGRDP